MNPEGLKGFAVSALVSAAASFGMPHVATAPGHAASTGSELAAPALEAPSSAWGDSTADACSDGGCWDWIEQQHAMP